MTEEKSILEKNLELWERFVNTNMDLLFTTVEKAMEGSNAFQEQVAKAVDKTMDESGTVQDTVTQTVNKTLEGSQTLQKQVTNAVSAAVSVQLEATLAVLKSLERQVESLSDKVDQLVDSESEE
jgi:hypothetical protein